jgi:Flp pilus assembly protein TadG
MKASTDAPKRFGFLARLRKDQTGNTFAIFAAAIFPMVGLVGGAVDMGRVYAVKTRMQAACDAGSLAARKVMGSGNWTAAAGAAGQQMFASNFESGFLGTKALEAGDVTFTESNGTVTGSAEAVVPMALMQVLGIDDEVVTVECTSQMKIPHTDVMFVLDVTGSMDNAIAGDTTVPSKLAGIQRATKCFYEALARRDISDVTPANCYKTANPVGDLSTLTQLRFGFVPYSQQVNIGNILPNGLYKDTQSFQSRRPNLETVQTWTLGTAGAISGWNNNWSPAMPSTGFSPNIYAAGSYSSFAIISSGSGSIATNQGNKNYNAGNLSSTNCNNLNTLQTSGGTGGSNTGLVGIDDETPNTPSTPTLVGSPSPPTHPQTDQVLSYQQQRTTPVRGFRYRRFNSGGVTACYLERSAARNYTQTQTGGTAYRPITWTPRQRVLGWTYTQVAFNISAIKAGGGDDSSLAYNGTVAMPISETTNTVNLSGSSTSSSIRVVSNMNVAWGGCVEEQTTYQNTDGTPADDYATIPDDALDMDVDLVPDASNENTRWGFQLPNAVWARYSGSDPVSNDIYSTSTTALARNTVAPCLVTQARKLATYNSDAGSISFRDYVNSFDATGNTYHDFGLLWGARLMSPTGIFADENATTEAGAEIQRHMVFMTDGDAASDIRNYTPYGIEGWDRRRTPSGTAPTEAQIDDTTDARLTALCNKIKTLGNSGVTLWVVYYGPTNSTATVDRMKACATSASKHYFHAANTQLLIQSFNSIADSISELKLTS